MPSWELIWHKLAKFLGPILSSLIINEYNIKDFFASAKETTRIDCNYVMASLDVESIFINMPIV